MLFVLHVTSCTSFLRLNSKRPRRDAIDRWSRPDAARAA